VDRIAIIGAAGQLGSALREQLGARAIPLRHADLELNPTATNSDRIREILHSLQAQAVINAAAYNWVDQAEREPELAYAINALGPRQLALVCEQLEIPLLHISSDYVFGNDPAEQREKPAPSRHSGHDQPQPWTEADAPLPTSAYAVSKLAGEYFVRANCSRAYVLRTCGLYGQAESAGKGNFVKTMLRLGRERGTVSVVNDQHCTPTSACDLAAAIVALLPTGAYGLYHATNSGETTWCDFAREIFRVAGFNVIVTPQSTAEYATQFAASKPGSVLARRPSYSVLDGSKLSQVLGRPLPTWQAAVADYVRGLET